MGNNQSAVEWLIEQMFKGKLIPPDTHPSNILFSHAKMMEKDQMKGMYEHGSLSLLDTGHGDTFEQYYNETYGK